MNFRIEEKISLTKYDAFNFYELLKNLGMLKLYEPRIIKSIYFDNNTYSMFAESEEGVHPRKKIRIREYGNSTNSDILFEKKLSTFEGRFKTSKKIDQTSKKNILKKGYYDKKYGICSPKLIVVYNRSYYKLFGIRITQDKQMEYFNHNNINKKVSDPLVVFEIKSSIYDSIEILDRYIGSKSRFSKYSRAIIKLNMKRV